MILDEESPDGETLPAETVSEFDILLAGEEVQEKNVLRNFDLPLQADAGEYLGKLLLLHSHCDDRKRMPGTAFSYLTHVPTMPA